MDDTGARKFLLRDNPENRLPKSHVDKNLCLVTAGGLRDSHSSLSASPPISSVSLVLSHRFSSASKAELLPKRNARKAKQGEVKKQAPLSSFRGAVSVFRHPFGKWM